MLFYYGRNYGSSSVGSQVVQVQCDKCGCKYFYELARIGSGHASAPYGIGSAHANRTAAEGSKRDLDRRLALEAELVPCPDCHWINEDLIAGYRLGLCRGWVKFAACIGTIGTVISLLGAWFVSIGPEADRGAVPYFLLAGPAISMTLAGVIVLARNLFRNSIQPNRHFPLPPRLPHGSPTALILNVDTGQPEAPRQKPLFDDEVSDWIDFQIGRHSLPALCSECLLPPTPRSSYQRIVLPSLTLVVPFCTSCARRWNRRMLSIGLSIAGLIIASTYVILLTIINEFAEFWICFGLGCSVAFLLGYFVAYHLTTPIHIKIIDGSRGILRLRFRSLKYQRLVSLSEGNYE